MAVKTVKLTFGVGVIQLYKKKSPPFTNLLLISSGIMQKNFCWNNK